MKKTSSEPAFDLFADIEEPTPEVGKYRKSRGIRHNNVPGYR